MWRRQGTAARAAKWVKHGAGYRLLTASASGFPSDGIAESHHPGLMQSSMWRLPSNASLRIDTTTVDVAWMIAKRPLRFADDFGHPLPRRAALTTATAFAGAGEDARVYQHLRERGEVGLGEWFRRDLPDGALVAPERVEGVRLSWFWCLSAPARMGVFDGLPPMFLTSAVLIELSRRPRLISNTPPSD